MALRFLHVYLLGLIILHVTLCKLLLYFFQIFDYYHVNKDQGTIIIIIIIIMNICVVSFPFRLCLYFFGL